MNEKEKKAIRTSKILITVIIVLIAIAVGVNVYNPPSDFEYDKYSEIIEDQISLELKDKQSEINDVIVAEDMEEGESIRKDYIVRINHTRDMKMYLKVNVLTQTDGIAEALNLKLYDTTNEKLIFDDSIKNLDNTVYERMMPAQGSKKNDTMYVAEAYFDAPVGDKYKMSELEVELKWYVAEEDAKDLIMAKAGDLKIILYSFIAALVVIIFLVVFGRKHLNKQVFAPIEFDDEGRDDYR